MSKAQPIPVKVENIMNLRRHLTKMYLDNPCEITWRVLVSSAVKDGTTILGYLEEVSQFAAFDEDTPLEDLKANLEQVQQALKYLVEEITQTNIYPELDKAFTR